MKKKVTIALRERRGDCPCHRGHQPGDTFDFDTERGRLCPLAMHVAFPIVDIVRYGGQPPRARDGRILFACPDADVLNIFEIIPEANSAPTPP